MKNFVLSVLTLAMVACTSSNQSAIVEESSTSGGINGDSDLFSYTPLSLSNDELLSLLCDDDLNQIRDEVFEPALSQYTSIEKISRNLDLQKHIDKNWLKVNSFNELENHRFIDSLVWNRPFISTVDSVLDFGSTQLVYLKMNPSDGESWSGPNYAFILRFDKEGEYWVFKGATPRMEWSWKYNRDPIEIKLLGDTVDGLLFVRGYANGTGVGRDGVSLYSMQPFGKIVFNKAYYTYKNISNFRESYINDTTAWYRKVFPIDYSDQRIGEFDITYHVDLDFSINPSHDSLLITHDVDVSMWLGLQEDFSDQKSLFEDSIKGFQFIQKVKI